MLRRKATRAAVRGLLAAGFLLAPPQASAASRLMLNLWKPAPLASPQGPQTVRRLETVFRQRLLPTGLNVVEAEAVDARSGEVVVPNGAELFELGGQTGQAWCDTAPPGGTERPTARPTTLPRHRCLMDEDGDGRFDGSFEIDGTSWSLPAIFGRRPGRLRPLSAPVPYRRGDPAAMKVEYYASLVYYGPRLLPGRVFELVAGVGELTEPIASAVIVGSDRLPRSFERRGARFTVISMDEGSATVTVENGLPETMLSPIRTLQISP